MKTNGTGNGRAQGIGHNGGPLLDDDAKQRIKERIQRDKHLWREAMDRLRCKDLNALWASRLTMVSDEQRARLPDKITHACAESLKRLYSTLCLKMSHNPDDDPGVAWPKQADLAEALGWSERNVRDHMRLLEVLGFIETRRTKQRPRQCVTRNHYRLSPPPTAAEIAEITNRHTACLDQPAHCMPFHEPTEEHTNTGLSEGYMGVRRS